MGISRTATRILDGAVTSVKLAAGAVTSAKLDTGAVTDAKLASASVTETKLASGAVTSSKLATGSVAADNLGSSLAEKLGVSQTGTTRSVTITQTAETTTTNTTSTWSAIATSSELTTAGNGLLQVGLWCEAKSSNAAGLAFVRLELNDAGTWVLAAPLSSVSYTSSGYALTGNYSQAYGATYRKIGTASRMIFTSGAIESSTGKSQFRVVFATDNASYTAYVKNLTATMTYTAF